MPVTRGMFGAPVYLADAPDILGPAVKFRELGQRDRALDLHQQQQNSLDANRQTLSGLKQKEGLTQRLGALIHLSADNPDMATKFLDGDVQLQQAFGIKPGQYEFQGKKGKDTVVIDRYGGRSFLIDTTERDPAKAIRPGPPITRPPLTKGQLEADDLSQIPQAERVAADRANLGGKKSTRARTRAEIAAGAAGGNADDAKLFAQTGGLSGYMHSLLRRGAGGDVLDPDVQKMDPKVARHHAAELGKLNGMNAIMQDALGSDPAYGGTAPDAGGGDGATVDEGGGGAVDAAPAAAPAAGDGFIRFRNAAGQVIRTKDPNLAPPPGFEPLQ